MSPLTKGQTISNSSLDRTSVQPLEKEKLKSTGLEKEPLFISDRCAIRVANRFKLRQKAYEFVYNVYLDEGYINKENSKLRLSIYHALPDTTTFIAEDHKGNFCGTLTMVFDSPIGLPSDLQYKREIENCTKCPLHKTRTNFVFGVGNENADILFVGEAPGKNEDLQGKPFVGQAGQLLNKMLAHIHLKRSDVYIANI